MRAFAISPASPRAAFVSQGRPSPRKQISPMSFLNFGNFISKTKKAPTKRPTVIPEPSYNIPIVLLGVAGASHAIGNDAAAGFSGILGLFLAVQASRVRFVFDDEGLEVVIGKVQEKTENVFVGGENRWSYDSFVNW
jgi:hypothetical protein